MNAAPKVGTFTYLNSLLQNLSNMLLFPTPESPSNTTLTSLVLFFY